MEKKSHQRYAATFTTGEVLDRSVAVRTIKSIHGSLKFAVQIPSVMLFDEIGELTLLFHQSIHLIVGEFFHETCIDFFIPFDNINNLLDAFLNDFFNSLIVIQFRFLV